MGTKMKGVLKGLRYISQIFEDEKEPEMQIGFPTDVKHVAHIGFDGSSPSVNNSPSWMKEYKASEEPQTDNDDGKENSHLRCSSQGDQTLPKTNRYRVNCQRIPCEDRSNINTLRKNSWYQRGSKPQTSPILDLPDLPKSSRTQSFSGSSPTASPKGSKSRQSRKKSSDSSRLARKERDSGIGSKSPSKILLGPPKKSSRKKTKEKEREGSPKSRTEDVSPYNSCSSSFSEPSSSSMPNVKTEDKG